MNIRKQRQFNKKTMTYLDDSSMILREYKQIMLFSHHYLHGLHLHRGPTKRQQFSHNQCEQLQSKLFDLLYPHDWDLHLCVATAELNAQRNLNISLSLAIAS